MDESKTIIELKKATEYVLERMIGDIQHKRLEKDMVIEFDVKRQALGALWLAECLHILDERDGVVWHLRIIKGSMKVGEKEIQLIMSRIR